MTNRGLLVSLLVVLVIQVYSTDQNLQTDYTFQQFEKQFGRTYQGQQREEHRKAFNKNYQELLAQRSKSEGQYQVQVNNFTDMTDQELTNFLNYRPTEQNLPFDQLPAPNKLRALAQPQALNYTAQGKVTPVKAQGKCGACWAFTTTAMYESQLLIRGIGQYDLAEQYVLQCTPGGSCNGGWPIHALDMFGEKGIPLQSSFPYKGQTPNNPNDQICESEQLIKLPYKIQTVKHYNSVPDSQLRQILLDNGPVSVGLKGSRNGFLFYSGGVFSGCEENTDQKEVDHVVLLTGWTKDGDWIIKNSWGKSWGDRGYAVISGKRNCGITQFVDVLTVGNVKIDDKNGNVDSVSSSQMQNLKITMTDSFGDGWNGYIMGIRQYNSIVTVFGQEFKAGSSQGPIDVEIKSGIQTEIVVAVVGKNSQEIGFTITDSQGKELCSRKPGSQFHQSILFCSFCPSCESTNLVTYEVTLTDASKNGWNGNVLAFKQDGISNSFGQQFLGGQKYGPRKVEFIKNLPVEIWPYMVGERPQDVGFQIRDSFGNIVAKRQAGTSFTPDTKLGQFCPGCQNIFPVNYDKNNDASRDTYVITREADQISIKPFIIAVAVLASLVAILIGVVIWLVVRGSPNNYLPTRKESMPSGGSILVSTATIPDDIGSISQGKIPHSNDEIKLN